jgi:hypothetical protein
MRCGQQGLCALVRRYALYTNLRLHGLCTESSTGLRKGKMQDRRHYARTRTLVSEKRIDLAEPAQKPFSDGTVAVDLDPLSRPAVSRRRCLHRACPPSRITKRVIPFGTRGWSRRRLSCAPSRAEPGGCSKTHDGRARESVGGASQENIWFRRSDVPVLQRKDEAAHPSA